MDAAALWNCGTWQEKCRIRFLYILKVNTPDGRLHDCMGGCPGYFLYDRKFHFLSYKNLRWIALRRKGKCRLRDPPRRQSSLAGRIPQAGFFFMERPHVNQRQNPTIVLVYASFELDSSLVYGYNRGIRKWQDKSAATDGMNQRPA